MRRIWKYELTERGTGGVATVEMPDKAKILSVGIDLEGRLCVWADVNPDALRETRRFVVALTGTMPPSERWQFVGTVTHALHRLVYHVYQEKLDA